MSYQTKADGHPSAKAHWRSFYSARELKSSTSTTRSAFDAAGGR